MSAIITKALSSTLKIFLKDYNKQQLNLKLFGGEATLDSISTITLISFIHTIYIPFLSSSFLLSFFNLPYFYNDDDYFPSQNITLVIQHIIFSQINIQ